MIKKTKKQKTKPKKKEKQEFLWTSVQDFRVLDLGAAVDAVTEEEGLDEEDEEEEDGDLQRRGFLW